MGALATGVMLGGSGLFDLTDRASVEVEGTYLDRGAGAVLHGDVLGGQVLDQKGEGLVHGLCTNDVTVVEHKDAMVRDGADVIEQRRQDHLRRGGLRLPG